MREYKSLLHLNLFVSSQFQFNLSNKCPFPYQPYRKLLPQALALIMSHKESNLVCSIRSEYISSNTVSSLFIHCFLTRYSCQRDIIHSTSMVMKGQAFFMHTSQRDSYVCINNIPELKNGALSIS